MDQRSCLSGEVWFTCVQGRHQRRYLCDESLKYTPPSNQWLPTVRIRVLTAYPVPAKVIYFGNEIASISRRRTLSDQSKLTANKTSFRQHVRKRPRALVDCRLPFTPT